MSKCFSIHDILSQSNQHQSLSLLRLVFLHFVSALSNPSLFKKPFLFLSFFSCFWSCFFSALMLCKPGFYFLFRNNASFKTVSGEIKAVMPKIVASRREEHFQLCYLIMVLQIFTTPTNSGCFINVYHTNPISWKQENVQQVNIAKSGSLVWQLPMPLAINCLCFLLIKKKIQVVLKTLRNFPVDIDHKERARWIFYLSWSFIWRTGERCKQKISSRRKKISIPANIRLDQDVFRLRLRKTSSRRLDQNEYVRLSLTSSEDVLVKTNIFVLAIRLQDVFKTSCQDVFKTSCKKVFKISSRRIIKLNCSC